MEERHRVESECSNRKISIVLTVESGHIILLASICDSMHEVLPTRKDHPTFLLGLCYIGMIDWLIPHVVELSLKVDRYQVTKSSTLNHMVDLSGMASPTLKLGVVSSHPKNKDTFVIDYLLEAKGKGQTSLR